MSGASAQFRLLDETEALWSLSFHRKTLHFPGNRDSVGKSYISHVRWELHGKEMALQQYGVLGQVSSPCYVRLNIYMKYVIHRCSGESRV